MEHLKNFLAGVAELFPRQPEFPSTERGAGWRMDQEAMRSDWRNLGNDMRAALQQEERSRASTKPAA